jgi:D-alanyl-D-alanine carboxypeptidase/D-alanyl-D-alanine-endopeptidase (penicillin-binding protein 4)
VPATAAGLPAVVEIGPPGHGLDLDAAVTTAPAGSPAAITIARIPGDARLVVRGAIAAGSTPAIRTAAVDRPAHYFLDAMRLALASRGIGVTGGVATMRELTRPVATGPQSTVATRTSAPLSSLAGYAMKVSQNFYGETFLKAIGATTGTGSAARGREAVAATLGAWGLPADALVMADGSGLSRYDYVSADLLTGLLAHVWHDEALRGPFVAALPVGGRDGTLENRMRTPALERRVQAKTGTISNVRALSGYLTTAAGEKLAFSIIVNNATAPGARIDAVVEAVLAVLVR